MADIQKFSAQVADYAERLSNMADAAEGKGQRTGSKLLTRWVVLPASGAALYALVRSDFFSRQAKDVVDEAKTRASDLPDDLVARVRQTGKGAPSGNGSQRRSSTSRSTKTSSARKSTSAAKSGSRR